MTESHSAPTGFVYYGDSECLGCGKLGPVFARSYGAAELFWCRDCVNHNGIGQLRQKTIAGESSK